MLPSEYIAVSGLSLSYGAYINTGVTPSSEYTIDALFSGLPNGGYVFGARNTNSTTSAGQYNLYTSQSATSYFGYRSARISLTDHLMDLLGFVHVHSESYQIEVVSANAYVVSIEGNTTAFTGTQPMYIGCMNNAGSPSSSGSCTLHGFKIYEDGTLIHDFVPCYSTLESAYGVYDTVDEVFIRRSSSIIPLYLLTIEATQGGSAYCHTLHEDFVKQVYAGSRSITSGYNYARLVAIPDAGYSFINWTDSNGNIVSTDAEFEYSAASTETLTANFIKETSLNATTGYKCMGIKYGEYMYSSLQDDFYSEVISAGIKEDTMQKSTSTIVLKNVPSVYQANMPVVLFNPKGRPVFLGVIQSIEGNTLTCREPMSIYDDDFLFHVNTSLMNSINLTLYSVMYGATNYMDWARNRNTDNGLGDTNPLQQRKLYPFFSSYNQIMNLNESRVFNVRLPKKDSVSISNLEDYLLSLFDDFGIYVRTSLKVGKRYPTSPSVSHYFEMIPTYIKDFETLKLSDNVENIQNVAVNIEEAESTVLIIYNSAGTSVRAYVGMQTDGSLKTFNASSTEAELQKFVGYDRYRVKAISSDDDMATLKAQNLSNSMYNHKITFTLGLDGKLFDIDTLKLGQPVDFYYKDKLYSSVITGLSFNINENDDVIHSVNVTMGKVRTSLTSKLNLGKVKK